MTVKRALIALVLVVLVAGGAVLAYVLYVRSEGADVRGSSTVEFVTTQAVQPPPPPKPAKALEAVVWPAFGYDPRRTHFLPGSALQPPFRRVWTFRGGSLLEFPPAIAYGRLFLATNAGNLNAVSALTGRRAWRYVSHRCVAASPAVHDHVVFEAFLNRPPCNSSIRHIDGRVIAFDTRTGRILWNRKIGPFAWKRQRTSPVAASKA